jgi:hypothetical protein
MRLIAGQEGACAIGRVRERGERGRRQRHAPIVERANLADQIVAILARHGEVAQQHIGPGVTDSLNGFYHGSDGRDLSSPVLQHRRNQGSCIRLVVGHEHTNAGERWQPVQLSVLL